MRRGSNPRFGAWSLLLRVAAHMSPSPVAPDRWQAWDRLLAATPETGFMQSSWWAEFRTTAGFEHFGVVLKNSGAILGGAVVLKFTYADDRCFYYVPEGPVLPGALKDAPGGNLVGVAGVSVGFGSNFMNAIYAEQRLILNNGSHRAFTLRQMGVTHVPCIVQHVASRDELEVVASSSVRRNPDLYLKHARPPMLKDYFHPQLRMDLPVHRRLRQVTVRIEVEEDFVPAL